MLQEPCGLIGTLGSGFPGALQETGMTTPDAIQLQRIFSELRAQRAKYVAMEVSSHSLDQGRVQGLDFEVGIFTNLTQDHLDYHGDIATYAAVKKRFFTDYPLRHAIINADDAVGQELITVLPAEKVFGYSLKGAALQVRARERLIYVQKLRFDLSGMRAEVFTPWGDGELYAPLLGEFNLSNVLAVLATLGALGIPLDTVLACLARLAAVPGRMQLFGGAQEPRIIVDYAHTPDALEKTLRAVRQHCQGKLYCVFGCGGERDRGKRPLMGAIAEEHADQVLLTNDNPRHENPQAILAEILAGMKNPERVIVEPNRSKAIQDAIQCAKAGDYILIAGKGAETYQQIGDEKLPFNDGEKILEFLGK
jgi:UDP-N-acetylmuramoyl-L-alanyl-D-glutamate--2,6-diaminopimelate ligase